jgi:RNA polymerase sigma factor (sigma-70 family)
MQKKYDDSKQDLILFLLELIKDIDVSKFPVDNSFGLNRYICVSIKNEFYKLANKNTEKKKHRFEFNEEIANKNPFKILDSQPDIEINIEFETIKAVELEEALNLLSTQQKNVIVYKYIYGFSDAEIGEIFNISRQAVNRLKNRAFEILKKYYDLGEQRK